MRRSEQVSQQLKLQQLRVFVAVTRTGSMAKAARQLATSQSVVSKTIAELERVLGVHLLDRTPQGVEPTLFGESLLKRSIAILDDLRASVGEIEFLTDPGVGHLRIGTTEPQIGVVVSTIKRLSKEYSGLDFTVMVAAGPTLIESELRGRHIDLAVAPLPKTTDADLSTTLLYHNRMRIVVSTQSHWARRRKIKLSELINEPWCVPPIEVPGGAPFADAFRAAGLPLPRIVVSCANNHLCHEMLVDARFLGVSSDGPLYFGTDGPGLKVLTVDFPAPLIEISVIALKSRTGTPLSRLFINCARELAKPLVQDNSK
jgi:DNA-binding transcriptional LysR family regulator